MAEVLAQHGADIVLSYKNSKKEADDAIRKIKKFGIKTMSIQTDVSSRKSVIDSVNEIKKRFEKIDTRQKMILTTEKDAVSSATVAAGVITMTPVQREGIVTTDTYILTPTVVNNALSWKSSGDAVKKGYAE